MDYATAFIKERDLKMTKKTETNQQKQPFFTSMKFKIMVGVFLASAVTSFLVIALIVPSARTKLENATNQNMLSTVQGYGQYIDRVRSQFGITYKMYDGMLGTVCIEGIESSYVYLVDKNGIMVYHPSEDKVGSAVENEVVSGLVSQIQSGVVPTDDVVSYSYKGAQKTAAYHILSDGAILVITADTQEILDPVAGITRRAIQSDILILILVSIAAFLLSILLTKPLDDISTVVKQIADFDFRDSDLLKKTGKKRDEIGAMAREIEIMNQAIHDSIVEINNASGSIHSNVNQLETITNEINSTCTDNSATTQQLAAGMHETTTASERINSNISIMIDKANKIKELINAGEENADAIKQKASNLHDTTEKATNNTQAMYTQVKENSAIALEQAKAVEKINDLTKAIMDIADQTNLLSLNASIEAARAGEAGKGFAVVADEIGGLAHESANTVSSINEIIGEVNSAVSNMSDCLNSTIKFLEDVVLGDYSTFGDVSLQYHDDADGFKETMSGIENAIVELTEAIEDTSSSVSGITDTINDSASGVENIAEKTSDIVERTSQNTTIVEDCSEAVNGLNKIVQKFILE